MKIRTGFVSNSSSSSFVVIDKGPIEDWNIPDELRLLTELTVVSPNGNYEFGWERITYYEVWDKINFAYLQTRVAWDNGEEWRNMLSNVLKKYTSIKEILWTDTNGDMGYIDHQSSASEGENTEIFESEEVLAQFLFNRKSVIVGNNDNS